MKTLLAGPWLGEFGWELCTWVPAMRYLAEQKRFEHVVVICQKGHDFLYWDFADEFIFYNKKGKSDRWLLNGKKTLAPKRILKKYKDATYYAPSAEKCLKWNRSMRKYGNPSSIFGYDIVIHARHVKNRDWIDKKCGGSRNWGRKNWESLVKMFHCCKICCIGTEDGAYHIDGTDDMRGATLQLTCDILAASKVAIGESSGPMHLASYCGCPHVVITDSRIQRSIGATNKERYRTLWNRYQTKCKIIEHKTWNPTPREVEAKLEGWL